MKFTLVRPTRWIRSSAGTVERHMDTATEDDAYREAVLMLLLQEAPLTTVEEIVAHRLARRSVAERPELRDGIERAISDLAAIGVVNVEGRSVYASRAAREVGHLLEGGRAQ